MRLLVTQLPVGAQLAEDDLIADAGASRNSVRAALRQLAAEGAVDRRRRTGTTVNPLVEPQLAVPVPAGSATTAAESTVRIVGAPPILARGLGVAAGAPVVRSESTHHGRGSRWLEVDYRPSQPPASERERCEPLLQMITGCDPETAQLLGCAVEAPLLWICEQLAPSRIRFTKVLLRGEDNGAAPVAS